MEKENSFKNLSEDTRQYINLELDSFKLSLAEKLSLASAKASALGLILTMFSIFILLTVVALVVFLSEILGSLLHSLLIVSGLFLLLTLVSMLFVKSGIFTNSFVKFYCKLIFKAKEDEKK